MTQATFARHGLYRDEVGVVDPATATCGQHLVASPSTKAGPSYAEPLPAGTELPCVICPEPWSDLVGLPVLHGTYGNKGYVYGGPSKRGGGISLKIGLAVHGPTVLSADYTSVAPADAPLPAKTDPRIRIEKLAKKRNSSDSGVWLLHLDLPGFEPGRAEKTKTAALATAVFTLAVHDWHAAKDSDG